MVDINRTSFHGIINQLIIGGHHLVGGLMENNYGLIAMDYGNIIAMVNHDGTSFGHRYLAVILT